jgi:copper chaperone NosL
MKVFFQRSSFILILLTIGSCSTKPEAIVFGEDQCRFCKMTIADEKFGAELVTTKGKVYKFDDVKCFMDFINSASSGSEDIYEHKLVVDFAGEGALVDAAGALYLSSSEIRSPMGGQVAAFQSRRAIDEANKKWNGIYLSWDELVTHFK